MSTNLAHKIKKVTARDSAGISCTSVFQISLYCEENTRMLGDLSAIKSFRHQDTELISLMMMRIEMVTETQICSPFNL